MHALLLALPLAALTGDWTVDDDGPADFAEVADAIASPSVADGDTLRIETGNYASFSLTRDLRLVARVGTTYSAPTADVIGAHQVTIAGLSVRELTLSNVTGRVTLDECSVGRWVLEPNSGQLVRQGECRVEFCAQVVVRDSVFRGSQGCYPDLGVTRPGLSALGSSLALVDCRLYGGHDDICSGHPTEGARPGLELDSCFASLSACTLFGGDDVQVGAAPAILALDSDVRVRGSSAHVVRGGMQLSGGFAPAIAGANSSATISGVTYDALGLPAWVEEPLAADPYLRFAGSPVPGTDLQVELYGPPGATVQLLRGGVPRLLFLFGGLDPLWFQRVSILGNTPVVTAGQDVPVVHLVPLPPGPAGAGEVTVFQAWRPLVGGSDPGILSTPVPLVLRW